ncbi:hypothetical protein VTI74DRAFT_11476 [Chaetomium olivicolor]
MVNRQVLSSPAATRPGLGPFLQDAPPMENAGLTSKGGTCDDTGTYSATPLFWPPSSIHLRCELACVLSEASIGQSASPPPFLYASLRMLYIARRDPGLLHPFPCLVYIPRRRCATLRLRTRATRRYIFLSSPPASRFGPPFFPFCPENLSIFVVRRGTTFSHLKAAHLSEAPSHRCLRSWNTSLST